MGASTDSNFLGQLNLPGTYSAIATYEILEKAVEAAKENKANYSVGNILSAGRESGIVEYPYLTTAYRHKLGYGSLVTKDLLVALK